MPDPAAESPSPAAAPDPASLANLHVFEHPLIQQKLTQVRAVDTDFAHFRRLLSEIAALMTYEVSRDFATQPRTITTPLETMDGVALGHPVTLIPILRAGIGMTDGILDLIPDARVGHIGVYRDEKTLQPVHYYENFPDDVAAGPALIIDPMLATGGSVCHVASHLKAQGCTDIRLICLICAPEGVRRLNAEHPDVGIYAAALDRELDDNGFIRPGLGDAGDRLFGTT